MAVACNGAAGYDGPTAATHGARLGDLHDALVAPRRGLHVYVLMGDFAMMYALERILPTGDSKLR